VRILIVVLAAASARAQNAPATAFTYQGRLDADGAPAAGLHDFRFRLFDANEGGRQVGETLCADDVDVVDGLFTVILEFGQQFATADERHLEIEVRRDTGLNCSNATGFVTLVPRQEITAAPLATHAKSAFALAAADGSPTDAVFVDNNGNVGIGTTSPISKLHLLDENPNANLDVVLDTGLGFPRFSSIQFFDRGSSRWTLGKDNANGFFLDETGVGPRLRIPVSNGLVGINTTNPTAGLHVKREPATGGGTLALEGTTHAFMSFFPDGALAGRKGIFGFPGPAIDDIFLSNQIAGGGIVLANPNGFMTIAANGRVGVNFLNPGSNLHVRDNLSVQKVESAIPIMGVVRGSGPALACSLFWDGQEGVVAGDRKSFREPNPEDPATDIWYVCIEGPEAAMYVRGTANLANGRAVIELPSHFRSLASERGMTVQVTPLSTHSRGLCVTRKSLNGVEVRELGDGAGNYDFDWEVKAVRKRYEDYRVIRPWDEIMPEGADMEQAWQTRLEGMRRRDK